jgi:putative transposase
LRGDPARNSQKDNITLREVGIMPEHMHVSIECPPNMSQSKALQLLKGNLSFQLFRRQPKFRLRYPKGHFFSPGGLANSTGYATIETIDNYVKHQRDIHQTELSTFA